VPPKATYTKKDVVQAAYDLVAEEGLQRLTARAVAQRLEASTAPVYSNFATMEELAREVVLKAKDQLYAFATTPYTDNVFLNIGVGVALFARDHRNLFKATFLEGNEFKDVILELRTSMRKVMDRDESLSVLSDRQKDELLTKMSTFTYGFASQICLGLIECVDQNFVIETLMDVGACVVGAAIAEASG
jgi:AcrR family transcriptional regulator